MSKRLSAQHMYYLGRISDVLKITVNPQYERYDVFFFGIQSILYY